MKKRIGNDITFTWHIFRKSGEEQVPESFADKDVEVKLISPLQRPVTIEDVSIATGVVTFTFKGKHQVTLGNYVAILQENRGENGMVTLDVVNAVTLVPHSYMEEDGDEGDVIEASSVELESEIGQGIDAYTKAEIDAMFTNVLKVNNPSVGMVQVNGQPLQRMMLLGTAQITGALSNVTSYSTPWQDGQRYVYDISSGSAKIDITRTTEYEDGSESEVHSVSVSPDGIYCDGQSVAYADELAGKQDTITDLATIRSGASAGATAVQPSDLTPITNDIDAIEQKIPAQASSSNQLADKDYVNSSIATATATYRGSYNLVSDLLLSVSATQQQIADALATKMAALSITPDNNDYCFVQIPTADATPTEIARIDRYKYDGTAWAYEYSLNNSSFTAAQWAALNSGISSGLVGKLSDLPTNSELTALLSGKANTADLADKQDKMPIIQVASGTTAITAAVNTYYEVAGEVGALAITLPTITGATKVQGVTFMLQTSSSPSVTFRTANSATINYQKDFAVEANGKYEVTALWNGSEWTLTMIVYQ